MYDGTVRKVQNIAVGDDIMGLDSQPRKVLSLGTGLDAMYRIIMHPELSPVREATTDSYVVNSEHILVLYDTISRQLINITVLDYFKLSITERNRLRGVKSNITAYPCSGASCATTITAETDTLEYHYQQGYNIPLKTGAEYLLNSTLVQSPIGPISSQEF